MRLAIFAILISLFLPSAASNAPVDLGEAVAMAERGAQFLRAYGKEEMIRRINQRDPLFNRGARYLARRDLNGMTVAHPTTALIVKNLLDVPDADGKLFRQQMLAIARGVGRGWVGYKFRNPSSGRVEAKTTYVLREGDVALEAGVYMQVERARER